MITRTMIAVTMVVLAITATYADEPTNAILPLEVEKAVLAEDWGEVTELLDKVNSTTSSPILRLLKAHASLVANRNNKSVGLFSVVTAKDINEWLKWCKNIANTTNNQALINYFLGDIYARLLNYEKAIEYLSLAINQNKNSYLALNARGAVYIIQEEYEKALSDLIGAKRIKPDFADVYNNLAMINIRQRKGLIDNSKNSFLAVLKVNHDFALAYHGLGCLELLESKNIAIPEKNTNIQNALKSLPDSMETLTANEIKYINSAIDKQAEYLFADPGEEGTMLKKEFKIQQLSSKYRQYEQQRTHSNSNVFQKMGAALRSDFTQLQLTKEAIGMSQGDMNRLALRNSQVSGDLLNALSNRVKHLDIQRKAGNIMHQSNYHINTIIGMGGKIGGASSRYLDRANDAVYNIIKQRYDSTLAYKKMGVQAQDNYIQEHMTKGSFDGRTYRMQNPLRKSGMSEYSPSQSPAGYAGKLGVSHGIPGDRDSINNFRPAGATTDKTLITWNDGEWPFDPIFGLLYQIPQTVSDENQINTEEKK